MSFVVGGFAAIVALAAGILSQVDPLTSLWRAALAFALGWVAAGVWTAVTTNVGSVQEADPEVGSQGAADAS